MVRTAPIKPALLGGAASMAAGSIAAKLAFENGSQPAELIVPRFALPGVVFMVALPWVVRSLPRVWSWREMSLAVLSGVLLWLASWAEFEGLRRLPAAILILLLMLAPIWVALLRWFLWHWPITPHQGAALAAVVGGVAVMVNPIGGALDPLGVSLGLAASLGGAFFFLLLDRIKPLLSPQLAILVAMTSAGAVAIVADPGALPSQLGDSSLAPLAAIIGAAAAAWALLLALGLRTVDAVTAATILAAEPVCVAGLAFLFLGEDLSAREIAGGAITLAGVIASATPAQTDQLESSRKGSSGETHRTSR
jgi:drug/metabolite transporter (DMT)-like permease